MKKDELLKIAAELGLELDAKSKVADIKTSIAEAEKANANKEPADDLDTPLAKAGKRSAKAVKETADKEAKENRKATQKAIIDTLNSASDTDKNPKVPKSRPKSERHGKKYLEAAKLIDRSNEYSLEEAMELAQKTSTSKFDASVELHFNLGVDPRQADQNIRGTVVLPHGTGKMLRVAVFGNEDDVKVAKTAGADLALGDDLLEQFKKGITDFDVLVATPQTMPKLGQYAKLLGPKGLMPNPKSGTVTTDVSKAVKEAKAGKVEFRVDKQSIVHVAVGKVSFSTANLLANASSVAKAIQDARPASIKGVYLRSLVVTTTMGPSIKVNLKSLKLN